MSTVGSKYDAKWSDREILLALEASTNWTEVHERLGIAQMSGTTLRHLKQRAARVGFDHQRYVGAARSSSRSPNALTVLRRNDSLLQRVKAETLRRAMIDAGIEYRCSCGNTGEWLGVPMELDIDHLDENWRNNEVSNLRFLCPNCHRAKGVKKRSKTTHRCECGAAVSGPNRSCRKCVALLPRTLKGDYPDSLEVIQEDVARLGWRGAAKVYGVSDNALRKRVDRMRA